MGRSRLLRTVLAGALGFCLCESSGAPYVDPTPHAVPKAAGGVYVESAPLTFGLFNVSNDVSVGYRVVDWRDRELQKGVWPTNFVLTVRDVPRGYYRIEIDGDVARGTTFAVVGDPDEMASPRDSFYGTDAAFSWCAGAFTCPWNKDDRHGTVAELIRLSGLKHVRERLQWKGTQWTRKEPDYGHYRRCIDKLGAQKLVALDYFEDSPPWASLTRLPGDLGALYDYAKRTAAEFAPVVDSWEFWNEEEGSLAPEPVWDYTAAMKAAALGYRAGMPGTIVLNGPLFGFDRVRYTEEVFRGGAWKYVNAFSFHYYESPAGCETTFERLRAYLKRNGLEGARVFVTECGSNLEGRSTIPAPPPWEKYMMHSRDQEMLLMEFYPKSQIMMQMSGVSRNYFFNFCAFSEGGKAHTKDWGLMRRDGTVKPMFAAIAGMTRALETSKIVGEMEPPAKDARAFLFERADGYQTVAYFTSSQVDLPGPKEIKYGQDRLVPFSLPVCRQQTYVLTDPVGGIRTVKADFDKLELTASRHAAYVGGFRGLKAKRPAAPEGKLLGYKPTADEDLTVVFRIDLNTNDFTVGSVKSQAEMRVDRGRVKVTAWNLDGRAKSGKVNWTGAKLVGVPERLDLPAFGSASFEAALEPEENGGLDTRLVIDGVFDGKRTTALEMPLFFERKFIGNAVRVEMKGSRDPKLWKGYGSQRDFACVWDEKEQAIRMDLAWDFSVADRWFFPRMSLGEGESLEGVKLIEFEVKSEQDKVENDYGCQYAQFDSHVKDGGGWISYTPPLTKWEGRRVSLGGVKNPESTSKIGFGGLPRGFRVTYWIRNIRMLKEKR